MEKVFWIYVKRKITKKQAEAVKKNDGVTLKDIVIAMGDVIQGSNVWQRYDLDESTWDKLISDAEDIYKQQPDPDLKKYFRKSK